jgi:hypothetical protein
MAPVTGTISIDADARRILGILLDVTAYPDWQSGYEKVEIQETDDHGRPRQVKWHVTAMGQRASHCVRYDYPDDTSYHFHLHESEVTTKYDFSCAVAVGQDGTSEVTVTQELGLKWPMPKRMLEKMSRKGIEGLLSALKTKAEQ